MDGHGTGLSTTVHVEARLERHRPPARRDCCYGTSRHQQTLVEIRQSPRLAISMRALSPSPLLHVVEVSSLLPPLFTSFSPLSSLILLPHHASNVAFTLYMSKISVRQRGSEVELGPSYILSANNHSLEHAGEPPISPLQKELMPAAFSF